MSKLSKMRVGAMIGLLLLLGMTIMADDNKKVKYNDLTPDETAVIVHKGTERPFSGELNDHWKSGSYICKRCDAPLYKSADKFDGHCGWPSFDDEIEGAVKRQTDADGRRTEILCANCDAHLGHLFIGEGLTDKNTRHCVNSITMKFVPEEKPEKYQKAYFAGGCFWGVEFYLQKTEGVISTSVGYMGGQTENPSYKEVCYENTGHAEAVEVVFNPDKISFEELAKLFFEIHDPTQVNRQGPDIGNQYRSAIFYANEGQKQTSEKLITILKDKGYEVVTEVVPADTYWIAEDYHQDYYSNKNGQPYCHAYQKKF